jgi:hypothetical protein
MTNELTLQTETEKMNKGLEYKWFDGMPVKQGAYVITKIALAPEPEQVKGTGTDGKAYDYTRTMICNNTTGKGRFAQGKVFGLNDKAQPVQIAIVGKLGNPAKDKVAKNATDTQLL